jgi:hypothetical protein
MSRHARLRHPPTGESFAARPTPPSQPGARQSDNQGCRFRSTPFDYWVSAPSNTHQSHHEEAMKYLCLIYDQESTWAALSKPEVDAIMGEYMTFTDSIIAAGKMVVGEELQPVHTATTVRVRGGQLSTTDGPFAETKEQLGGFYLIDATDLNEAIQIAARIPSVRTGCIEVRPVVVYG